MGAPGGSRCAVASRAPGWPPRSWPLPCAAGRPSRRRRAAAAPPATCVQLLAIEFDHSPVKRRRDLKNEILLRLRGVIAQGDLAASGELMALRIEPHLEIVLREGESIAIERETRFRTAEDAKDTEESKDTEREGRGQLR